MSEQRIQTTGKLRRLRRSSGNAIGSGRGQDVWRRTGFVGFEDDHIQLVWVAESIHKGLRPPVVRSTFNTPQNLKTVSFNAYLPHSAIPYYLVIIANRFKIIQFLLAASLLVGCSSAPRTTKETQSGTTAPAVSQSAPPHRDIGFASRERLVEHYQKHGREFGAITMEEYLRQAQDLRDRNVSDDVLEIVRQDRVITRFERSTGSFIAFNPTGTIRTYFKPNIGETYFHRQSQRGN